MTQSYVEYSVGGYSKDGRTIGRDGFRDISGARECAGYFKAYGVAITIYGWTADALTDGRPDELETHGA